MGELLLQFYTKLFETLRVFLSWSEDVHVLLGLCSHHFLSTFFHFFDIFQVLIGIRIDTIWVQLILHVSTHHFYTPPHNSGGVLWFLVDVHVSVHPYVCLSICPSVSCTSVCTYTRYIGRLAFIWVSVYAIIVGLKIVLWSWQIDRNAGVFVMVWRCSCAFGVMLPSFFINFFPLFFDIFQVLISIRIDTIWVQLILHFSTHHFYTPPHDSGGVLWFLVDVHVSVHPYVCLSICPSVSCTSVCTYTRYIGRLAFIWVSVYAIIVGLKIVLWGWQIDRNGSCGVKEDQRNNLLIYPS